MEERIIAADPVGDPDGYQREMLALLDGQDPVDVLGMTEAAVREYTEGLPQDLLARRPEPAEWSAVEVLGHLWDAELHFSMRARLILVQDAPTLTGYDQDAWARLARPGFGELFAAFSALRQPNLLLVRQTPQSLWERFGMHTERGRTSFRVLVETTAGHDRAHLRQLAQTVAAVSG